VRWFSNPRIGSRLVSVSDPDVQNSSEYEPFQQTKNHNISKSTHTKIKVVLAYVSNIHIHIYNMPIDISIKLALRCMPLVYSTSHTRYLMNKFAWPVIEIIFFSGPEYFHRNKIVLIL
jgi:hypothetical protein